MQCTIGPTRRGLLEGLLGTLAALVIGRSVPAVAVTGVERQIVEPNPHADRFYTTTLYEYDANGKCISVKVSQEPAPSCRTNTIDAAGRVTSITE